MRARLIVCLVAGLSLTGALVDHTIAHAQLPPLTRPPAPPPPPPPPLPPSATFPTGEGNVTVLADRLEEIGPDRLLVATGNVEITRGSTRLTADRVEINRETGDAVATGHVILYDGDDRLSGERIDYNVKTGTGVVYQGSAHAAPYYRVGGERMERLDPGRYIVRRGVFTTCEDEPPTWSFRFGTADADFEQGLFGTNGSFWVKDLPLVPFIPFFAAAIRRERQTGFLFPRFGSSTRKGLFAEIPFYWAIADNQDATFTLAGYTKRGVGGEVEYRYLLSREHFGSVDGFFIHETRQLTTLGPTGEPVDLGHGRDRGWWIIKHAWLIQPGLGLRADVAGVSDDDVFRDYGDLLAQRAAQRAESNVSLTKSFPAGNLVGRLFWYQDLTTHVATELDRLPEVRFDVPRLPVPGVAGALFDLESSAVNFVRDVGSSGARLDLHPRISRPIPVFGYFAVTPFAAGRLTGYDKTVRDIETERHGVVVERTTDDPRVRRFIEVGADVEARAARIFVMNGLGGLDAVMHSIEPRLNYTLRDGTDLVRLGSQGTIRPNKLPQWDAIDGIAESSAFTYSLVQRLRARTIAPEGAEPTRWELARLTLAQTYEARSIDRPFGDITGDLILDPNRLFRFRGDASYNVYGRGLRTLNTDVQVTTPRLLAAIGTRLARTPTSVDPLTGTVQTQPTTNFLQGNLRVDLLPSLVGRVQTNWDMRSGIFVENRVGVDIKWQCWALSVDFISRHNNEDEIRFTLNLLGLGAPLSTGAGLARLGGGTGGGSATTGPVGQGVR
jgi:LPS-assembly protein